MTAININRRRFMQIGSLGVGAKLMEPTGAEAKPTPNSSQSEVNVDQNVVRMTGDGLGLTPIDTASLWTRLATEKGIERDNYSIGGTVAELESYFAKILGKERAVFFPTGTLANHLAVRALSNGAGRTIVQAESHLFNDSGDCVQNLSGITLMPLAPGRATFRLDEVRDVIQRTASGRVARPVSVISLETPVRRRFGEMFDETEMQRITTFAKHEGINLHLDGARLFLQSAYTGKAVADYTRPFDTVYISLYKYFNAPSGAILAGTHSLLKNMYHARRMFGSGLPSAWPFAAIAHHYAPNFVKRFQRAATVSKSFFNSIDNHESFSVDPFVNGTNLFRLRVSNTDLASFRRRLSARGVILGPLRSSDRSFLLSVNETWNHMSSTELHDIFIDSLNT